MALSIFTSGAAMSSTNALNKSNSILSTAMERLGTGKRINSAADDAAGLQIATRLQGQVNGMGVAQRNVSDATAMLQTAEGAFEEVTNILYRMKDLATQSANATNSKEDRDALQGEADQLNAELSNILSNTTFGGEKLIFGANGDTTESKLGKEMSFQIGASKDETLNFDLTSYGSNGTDLMKDLNDKFGLTVEPDKLDAFNSAKTDLTTAQNSLKTAQEAAAADPTDTDLKDAVDVAMGELDDKKQALIDAKAAAFTGVAGVDLTSGSNSAIDTINDTLASVGTVRSALGSNINRLGHTAANLANMKDTTTLALGNIRDADFATEATNMTRNQMLAQTSMSMLKQANSMSGMVMSLLG
ncbi:flagellin [Buttiauxella noackiae]|uniref:flagellin N-terminal helical domain-containing protein n=1 Tax=Buttiauxella noackiae TaxID=82992 RepID=UPI0035A5E2C2